MLQHVLTTDRRIPATPTTREVYYSLYTELAAMAAQRMIHGDAWPITNEMRHYELDGQTFAISDTLYDGVLVLRTIYQYGEVHYYRHANLLG